MNEKNIGLKVGLEIHFQLATKHKLFCNCSTAMNEKKPMKIVVRKQHPVQSELGEIDAAAQYEYLRNRTFYYEVFENESCLVELDEEPPHPMNKEALETALQVALLMNCKIPDEIQVMRKIVIDGSNTSGFQRTAIVGFDGWIEYKGKEIPITQITIEEDAAAKVKEENGKVYYRLNRLGIPLIEVDTGILEGFSPEEIQEIAYKIGLIVQSTRKVRKSIGAIRQDVNVSIKGGARVEIKGVQRLGMIAKVIKKEIERQLGIIRSGKKVDPETRGAKEDGTTFFMRPLPGSGRMYPETDIPPVPTKKLIEKIKDNLPETIEEKMEKYEKMGLSKELVGSLLKSDYFFDFEEIFEKTSVDPKLIASTLAYTLKDLKRNGIPVENLNTRKLIDIFLILKKGKIVKENIPTLLEYMSKNNVSVEEAIEKLNIKIISDSELEKIIDEAINKSKDFKKVMAIVMSQVRGRADPKKVVELVKKKLV